ncbi:MAG: hypothetical protein HY242_16505 [Afipia sp.]|nr:hypothetical protein [Afipia sp.]
MYRRSNDVSGIEHAPHFTEAAKKTSKSSYQLTSLNPFCDPNSGLECRLIDMTLQRNSLVEQVLKLLHERYDCREQEEEPTPKERTSLAKILFGIAASKYQYDPNLIRSSAASRIRTDLATQGISLDEDTIRKYLQNSSAIVAES